ncbi:MAG TPA: type II secretion system F family protein [Vicinamibacteria bacterium]|nr:type II secretion system F family protein [Vicinamibacteria bacterium]
MPAYVFKGRTRTGATTSGERVADSKDAVVAMLRREQILVTSVKEKGKEIALPKFGGGIKPKDVAIFTRQFSVMIDAGLPLVQCLEILGTQQDNPNFQKVLLQVRQDVEGGSSLADAMKKHPKVFDELFTNMVAAGEAGGILDTILKRLATYIEKSVKLKSQVKSALVYPAAVISIAILVVSVILWKVIPTFAALFAGLGAQLPLPTRIVIAASNWFVRLLAPMVIGAGLGVYAIKRYHDTYDGRRRLDGLLLRMPIIGMILRKIAVARFCRTLATLISSGVPILDGLEITARTSGNAIVEDAIMATRKSVEGGQSLAAPLKHTDVFPPMVVQMISVGEQTGALDTMLSKIADFYEDEVDTAIANLMTLLEPILILFLGIVVGGIVISMYLPIFSLIQQLS